MGTQAKILVVDDQLSILKMLALTLEREGYQVDVSFSAEIGMDLCLNRKYDLIISDSKMSGMDGHQFAKWAAVNCPTKFILMSGFPFECNNCELAIKCEPLEKPFTPTEVIELVQKILGT